MGKIIDLTGQKFGRLTVVSFAENRDHRIYWNCLCECGNTSIVRGSDLKSGASTSCGCLRVEKTATTHATHGHSVEGNPSSTYHSWQQMKERCTNPNNKAYKNYGGRGITVCERWLDSFEHFLEDMGEKPSREYSIDRIDNSGNYCPENCQWSTRTEQQRNKRSNVHLTFNGETKLQGDWAKEWNITSGNFSYHLSQGRSLEWIYENKAKNK